MPERFIIDTYGSDDQAVQLGVRWLIEYANAHLLSSAGLVVHGVSNAQNLVGPLGDLGQRLYKDRAAYQDTVTIRLLTTRGGLGATGGGPLLAVWADNDMIEKAERANPPAICAIPWAEQDLAAWKTAWAPADLRTGAAAGPAPEIADPLVLLAMENLTARVNLSAPLAHPGDKRATGTTLKTLISDGAPVDSAEIEAWAVANGWALEGARELARMARKLLDGGRVHAGTFDAALLARWRERLTE